MSGMGTLHAPSNNTSIVKAESTKPMLCSFGSIGNAVIRVKKICLLDPEMALNRAIFVRMSAAKVLVGTKDVL